MSDSGPRSRPLPEMPSLRASALAPVLARFGDKPGRIETVLRRHGLSTARVRDPYEVIPLQAYLEIFEDAAELAGDPVLGARLGQKIQPADLGPTGLLMLQSGTLRRGLQRFAGALSALQSATDMQFSEAQGLQSISYHINSPRVRPMAQDSEFSLSTLVRMIRMGFDPRWQPLEVHFEHAPSRRTDLLSRIFRAPVLFGQSSNRLVFGAEGLDRVHRVEDAALILVIERHVRDLVLEQDEDSAVSDRVRSVVVRHLGQRPVDLESIAAELGMAARSLQRALAGEGTSLRAILQDHRQQIAETYLVDPRLSLKQVAQALGYSDGTVFWRAYRGWTGRAPTRGR
ncbi:AraC-type DNA-binding protein [Pseudooceanicola antarcticus]|uniref:AraC family transcriptional regulator n=1 Tax=Pseudooceanicola antarcticus TaxID=1247613 RepID=A0A285IJP4_9RHOB|nr:AraC family transcriptional regulator [Pseudooceanicola antarcticus]SNY48209.1 AraC-type DNA-binding protein [Pseudooceanicola antarcticus]